MKLSKSQMQTLQYIGGLAEILKNRHPNMVEGELFVACKKEGIGTGWSYAATGLTMNMLEECKEIRYRLEEQLEDEREA